MSTVTLLQALLAVVHGLAGAAWFGSMFYSFFVLHPRARVYFSRGADFESFIATVSRGARYPVLAALAVIGLSGLGLVLVHRPGPLSAAWLVLIAIKTVLFLLAAALFGYVSWHLWPARIFALAEEVPAIQRVFHRIAAMIITLAGLSIALGIVARDL